MFILKLKKHQTKKLNCLKIKYLLVNLIYLIYFNNTVHIIFDKQII